MRDEYVYPEVAALIVTKYGSQERFAVEWGRAQRTVSMKLHRKNEWTVRDIEELCYMLDIKDEQIPKFFIKRKLRKSE